VGADKVAAGGGSCTDAAAATGAAAASAAADLYSGCRGAVGRVAAPVAGEHLALCY
jgi:hypothetical protein